MAVHGSASRPNTDHPGFVAGNWYCPFFGRLGNGSAFAAGSIRMLPFTIVKPITIQALAARVIVAAAGGNFQLAIYAHNAATGRPTGAAQCSTASMSSNATGSVSASVTPTTLAPGTYWMAVIQDNATAAFLSVGVDAALTTNLVGSATLANVASVAPACIVLTVAQTYGTWPDLTSAAFGETTSSTAAVAFLQAA